MNFESVPFSSIKPAIDRLRYGNPELRCNLASMLKTVGLVRPVVINRRTMRIIDGRLVAEIWQSMGHSHVDACMVEIDEQTEAMVRLALNNHAGDWDWEAVSEVLRRNRPELSGFHSMDWHPLLGANWAKGKPNNESQFEMEL